MRVRVREIADRIAHSAFSKTDNNKTTTRTTTTTTTMTRRKVERRQFSDLSDPKGPKTSYNNPLPAPVDYHTTYPLRSGTWKWK